MTRSANLLMGTVAAVALMGAVPALAQSDEMTFGPETYSVDQFCLYKILS